MYCSEIKTKLQTSRWHLCDEDCHQCNLIVFYFWTRRNKHNAGKGFKLPVIIIDILMAVHFSDRLGSKLRKRGRNDSENMWEVEWNSSRKTDGRKG